MERIRNIKKTDKVDKDYTLTEEDIQHLLKSEEDIREGRVYTLEEFKKYFKERYGAKFDEI